MKACQLKYSKLLITSKSSNPILRPNVNIASKCYHYDQMLSLRPNVIVAKSYEGKSTYQGKSIKKPLLKYGNLLQKIQNVETVIAASKTI